MDEIQPYKVIIRNLSFNQLVDYTNVVADGFVPGTNVRWIMLATQQRIEFSLNNYVIEFSSERQNMIEKQPQSVTP